MFQLMDGLEVDLEKFLQWKNKEKLIFLWKSPLSENAGMAQSVERTPRKGEVTSSILVASWPFRFYYI